MSKNQERFNQVVSQHMPQAKTKGILGEPDVPAFLSLALEEVGKFHTAFGHPNLLNDYPQALTPERREFRFKILDEEVQELKNADTFVDQIDALVDTIYIALGTLVEMGINPDRYFAIVQRANMAKLGPDGKPIYHTEGEKIGKVKKPEGWTSPEPELEKQLFADLLKVHPTTQWGDMTKLTDLQRFRMVELIQETFHMYIGEDGYLKIEPKKGDN